MRFVPRLLSHVLPNMSHEVDTVRQAANKVNTSLMAYIVSITEESSRPENSNALPQQQQPSAAVSSGKDITAIDRRDSNISNKLLKNVARGDQSSEVRSMESRPLAGTRTPTPAEERAPTPRQGLDLDYQAAVNALTLQFLNEHEATRVAAIAWLIMLHRKAPGKVRKFSNIQRVSLTIDLDLIHRRWNLPSIA